MGKRMVVTVVIVTLLAGCSESKKEDREVVDIDQLRPTAQGVPQTATVKGKNAMTTERESWVAKEMKKEGYDPKNMTGKDYRRLFKVEE